MLMVDWSLAWKDMESNIQTITKRSEKEELEKTNVPKQDNDDDMTVGPLDNENGTTVTLGVGFAWSMIVENSIN